MISVTLLSSYLYCQRKLFLERVLGLFEIPRAALIKGTVRHETYDLINKTEESLVKSITQPIELPLLKDKYKKHYQSLLRKAVIKNKQRIIEVDILPLDLFEKTLPLIRLEAETRAEDIYRFIIKHNLYGEELWEKLTPKIISELRIESKNLGLKGIIDQIEVYDSGYVPVELKTGKAPKEGVWPGHKIQLAAYALLTEEKFKQEVKEGFVTYLDTQQRRHIPINQFLRLEVIELVEKVNRLITNLNLPNITENENKCNACSLKDTCYNQQEIQKLIDNKKSKPLNIRAAT